jgi:hypothetical protein
MMELRGKMKQGAMEGLSVVLSLELERENKQAGK